MQRFLAFLPIIYLIVPIGGVWAQSKIEIINSDEISFNQKLNKNRQVLRGNVKTKHKNRIMTCDSAYYYLNENKIEAFNNIHIWEEDQISIRGEYLIYHGNEQLAEIEQKVIFIHKDMRLSSRKVLYNFTSKKASFNQQAYIKQNQKSISSKEGVYDIQEEKFNFYKEVILTDDIDTLIADSVYYSLKTEEATFSSHVTLKNESMQINAKSGWLNKSNGDATLQGEVQIHHLIDGAKLFSDHYRIDGEKNTSISYGNALIEIPRKQDTLYLMGDTLHYSEYNDIAIFTAGPMATFQSKEITGKCDSLSYKKSQKEMNLFFFPAIWINEFLLTADTITVKLEPGDFVKEIELNKNAFISSKLNNQQFNQIKGEKMNAHFFRNKISNIEVDGNGESLYYVEEENQKTARGANKVICSHMNISIYSNKIKNITFYENADASIKPIDQVNSEDMQLKNFIWYEKQKTSLIIDERINKYKDLFERKIIP
jgi:lipopolysaccharide export system protein LptA